MITWYAGKYKYLIFFSKRFIWNNDYRNTKTVHSYTYEWEKLQHFSPTF